MRRPGEPETHDAVRGAARREIVDLREHRAAELLTALLLGPAGTDGDPVRSGAVPRGLAVAGEPQIGGFGGGHRRGSLGQLGLGRGRHSRLGRGRGRLGRGRGRLGRGRRTGLGRGRCGRPGGRRGRSELGHLDRLGVALVGDHDRGRPLRDAGRAGDDRVGAAVDR